LPLVQQVPGKAARVLVEYHPQVRRYRVAKRSRSISNAYVKVKSESLKANVSCPKVLLSILRNPFILSTILSTRLALRPACQCLYVEVPLAQTGNQGLLNRGPNFHLKKEFCDSISSWFVTFINKYIYIYIYYTLNSLKI
jgi:hypothetical protein